MNIFSGDYASLATIIAAVIGGYVSFLVTVLSKEQKTSEFRQSWIDGLRKDIAELISAFVFVVDFVRVMKRMGKSDEEIFKYIAEKDDYFRSFERAHANVKLRVNPREHQKLLSALQALNDYPRSGKIMDRDIAESLVSEAVIQSQYVLKSEWKRVKRGEVVYVLTKYAPLIIIVLAVLASLFY